MKKIVFIILGLFSISVQAQQSFSEACDLPGYDCNQRGFKNINKNELIIVLPNDSSDILSVNFKKYIKSTGKIKTESQLRKNDFRKALWILGPINLYSNWDRFELPVKKVNKGFKIKEFAFTDSLDGFNYITDSLTNPLRIVVSGNSPEAFEQANKMHKFGFEYAVLRDDLPIFIGDETKSANLDSIRKNHYDIKESKYFTFMLSKSLPDEIGKKLTNETLQKYDIHVERFVDRMELDLPVHKIILYIHADQEEITYNSGLFIVLCSPGSSIGGFVTGSIIHSTGLESVEHEANHRLFDQVNKKAPIFLAEGIQKWYEFSNDDELKKKGFLKAKEFINEDLTGVILGTSQFFQEDKYYLISGIFADYLLSKYGLNKFKAVYKYQQSEMDLGFEKTYEKPLSVILQDYKTWLLE